MGDDYVLCGGVEEFNEESSYGLARIDEGGNLLWQRSWRQSEELFSRFLDLITDPEGRLWTVGNSLVFNDGDPNLEVVARFSPDGELELANTYDSNGGDRTFHGSSIVYQPGVGIAVGGATFLPGFDDNRPAVLQAGPGGEVIWSRTLNTTPNAYLGGGVFGVADGGLLVGAGGINFTDMALLIRLDGAGSVSWAHTLTAGSDVENLFDLELDDRGNALGAGQAFGPGLGERDGVVFKVDDPLFNTPSCCTQPVPLDSQPEAIAVAPVELEAGLTFEWLPFDLAPQPLTLTRTPVCQTEAPAIALSDTLICPGQAVQWIFPDGQPDTVVSSGPVEICFEEEGDFEVLLLADSCSRAARSLRVEARMPPAFTLSETLVCPGECLEAAIAEPVAEDNYIWVFEGAEPDSAFGESPPLFCYPEGGRFDVALWIEGCGQITWPVQITYIPPAFPNAFTPNGDDNNDTFSPVFPCPVEAYDLRVYNRWGQEIFRSAGPADAWDGAFQGQPAPSDVYVWTLAYTDLQNGEEVSRQEKGEVVVLR